MKKQLTKTLLTALLVAVLMTVFAVSASAAETTVTTEDALRTAVTGAADGDVIIVKGTIEVTSSITLPAGAAESSRIKVTIMGNPADGADEIKAASTFVNNGSGGNASMFDLKKYSTVVFQDITVNANLYVKGQDGTYALRSGVETPKLRCVVLNNGSSYCELRGDTVITGGYIANGAGVYLCGKLDMYDNAKIIGNYGTSNGGGIYMSNSVAHYLNMEGNSAIEYNDSAAGGAGVYANAKLGVIALIDNATISHNIAAGNGGGIYAKATITLSDDSEIAYNTAASQGGGVRLSDDGIVNLTGNSSVHHNTLTATATGSTNGGAGLHSYGSRSQININDNAKVYENSAQVGGGGIHLSAGVLNVTDGHIYKNSTQDSGGAIRLSCSGPHKISGGVIGGYDEKLDDPATEDVDEGNLGNYAKKNGGAIYVYSGAVEVSGDAEISYNKAGNNGGGISDVASGASSVSGGTIKYNEAGNNGGGIYTDYSTITLSGGTIEHNSAAYRGGGIHVVQSSTDYLVVVKISEALIVKDNYAGNYGGGICVNSGKVYLNGGTISGNTAYIRGGGIYNNSTVCREDGVAGTTVYVTNNRIGEEGDDDTIVTLGSDTYERRGGGIENNDTFTMSNIEITGNHSPFYGGGVCNRGTLTLTNATVTGNTAQGSGAGIFNYDTLTLDGVKITGNTSTTGIGAGVQAFSNSSYNSQITIKGATQITGNTGVGCNDLNINVNKNPEVVSVTFDTGAIKIGEMRFAKGILANTVNVIGDLTGSEIGVYLEALAIDGTYTDGVIQFGTAGNEAVIPAGAISNTQLGSASAAEGLVKFAAAEVVDITFEDISGTEVKTYKVPEYKTYWLPALSEFDGVTGTIVGVLDTAAEGLFYTAEEIEDNEVFTKAATGDKKLTVIALEVATKQGASVNLSEKSGMRFVTKVDADVLEALTELGFSYQRGLMVSNESLTGVEIDTEKTNVAIGSADKNFVDAANHANATWKGNYYLGADETEAGYEAFSIALQLDDTNYETVFYFRGYVTLKLGEEEITVYSDYTDEYCRSARGVAQSYCGVINESETPVTLTDAQSSALAALSGWTCGQDGKWTAPAQAE